MISETDYKERIIRGCGDKLVKEDCMGWKAKEGEGKGIVCTCNTDYCNSAERHGLRTIIGIIATFILIKF